MESCSFLLMSHFNHSLICFDSWKSDRSDRRDEIKKITKQKSLSNIFGKIISDTQGWRIELNFFLNSSNMHCCIWSDGNAKWMRHFNEITLGKMPATNATWNLQRTNIEREERRESEPNWDSIGITFWKPMTFSSNLFSGRTEFFFLLWIQLANFCSCYVLLDQYLHLYGI